MAGKSSRTDTRSIPNTSRMDTCGVKVSKQRELEKTILNKKVPLRCGYTLQELPVHFKRDDMETNKIRVRTSELW